MSDTPNLCLLEDMVGQTLDGFTIQLYTEVFKTDVDGRKMDSLGFLRDELVARAFAQKQSESGDGYFHVASVYLLTNGKKAFLLGAEAKLLDGEKVSAEIREAALRKLSPGERQILGL